MKIGRFFQFHAVAIMLSLFSWSCIGIHTSDLQNNIRGFTEVVHGEKVSKIIIDTINIGNGLCEDRLHFVITDACDLKIIADSLRTARMNKYNEDIFSGDGIFATVRFCYRNNERHFTLFICSGSFFLDKSYNMKYAVYSPDTVMQLFYVLKKHGFSYQNGYDELVIKWHQKNSKELNGVPVLYVH